MRKITFPLDWCQETLRNEPHIRDISKKFSQVLTLQGLECDTCGPGSDIAHCDACFTCICMDCEYNQESQYRAHTCYTCALRLCAECGGHKICMKCGKVCCSQCMEMDDAMMAESRCHRHFWSNACCVDCMEHSNCPDCCQALFPVLLPAHEKLQREHEEVRAENDELRREVEELREKLGILSHKGGDDW